jgi:hypothetical protein
MHDSDIYTKTASGLDELKSRERRLLPRLRTMLIMVDGKRTVAELKAAAAVLSAPEDFLEILLQGGWVAAQRSAAVPPVEETASAPPAQPVRETRPAPTTTELERFTLARKLMNDSAVDALGFRAFLFTLKLERCFNLQDLRALLPEFRQGLAKTRGDSFADRTTDRVKALLG